MMCLGGIIAGVYLDCSNQPPSQWHHLPGKGYSRRAEPYNRRTRTLEEVDRNICSLTCRLCERKSSGLDNLETMADEASLGQGTSKPTAMIECSSWL